MYIKKVGATIIEPRHKAHCHCSAIELTLDVPEGLLSPRRCDCTMCAARGAIVVSVPLECLAVTRGFDKLSLYQFGSMTAKHYFCSVCGIYTHHQRCSDPTQFGVNLGTIDGVNPYDLIADGVEVPLMIGRASHPSD